MIWLPDNNNGTYKNPVIHADYSDPDVIRVNSEYFMVSSSFNCVPALPVLHSRDLVNWKIISHVSSEIPFPGFDRPLHGKGVWAPSIRYHDNHFWVYYGDPDLGIVMSKTKDPFGKWDNLAIIKEAKGWIDPCPLWDDDGNAYLVHAWAKSRIGFNGILTINKLRPDGLGILDEGVNVFDGTDRHPIIEGPKFYKRNGYYYIFAPAGGVPEGWQTILRSKNVYGPYEDKITLHQGNTDVNGPHQGAWIDTDSGESWFIHFQDKYVYGRVCHLQPIFWKDDWPMIGIDINNDGIGEPVEIFKKPVYSSENKIIPQTSDDFSSEKLGLQWQWQANSDNTWYKILHEKNILRLYSVPLLSENNNLWHTPNLLLQKFPAPEFTVTVKIEFNPFSRGEMCGLLVMGTDYAFIGFEADMGLEKNIIRVECLEANTEIPQIETCKLNIQAKYLRIKVSEEAKCDFYFSDDGISFEKLGEGFQAKKGMWIGAKIGIFSIAPAGSKKNGFAEFMEFNIT